MSTSQNDNQRVAHMGKERRIFGSLPNHAVLGERHMDGFGLRMHMLLLPKTDCVTMRQTLTKGPDKNCNRYPVDDYTRGASVDLST